jgi:hypothetical protein
MLTHPERYELADFRAHYVEVGVPNALLRAYEAIKYRREMSAMLDQFAYNARAESWIYCGPDAPTDGYLCATMSPEYGLSFDDLWGDVEPTQDEIEAASFYVCTLTLYDSRDREVWSDSIGNVDAIDLPGYVQRDAEDALAYALVEYLMPEYESWRESERREATEAAYWRDRGVMTVG